MMTRPRTNRVYLDACGETQTHENRERCDGSVCMYGEASSELDDVVITISTFDRQLTARVRLKDLEYSLNVVRKQAQLMRDPGRDIRCPPPVEG